MPLDTKLNLESRQRVGTWNMLWLEIVLVVCVMAIYGGQPPPDVNESHYLTKARHFWNPLWCQGDLFLDSSNAHVLFFAVCGWITNSVSLAFFASLGRVISWTLIATAWCKLNRTLGIRFGLPILSILFFLILMDRFHMAGEWVVGGFEAKTISYGFVLLAINSYLKRQRNWFWITAGFACAFHVVVGTWTLIALGIASLVAMLPKLLAGRNIQSRPGPEGHSTRSRSLIAALAGFVALFLMGAVPPLWNNFEATAEAKNLASQILVHHRLGHHLLFGSFPTIFLARFSVLIILWALFARLTFFDEKLRRLNLFCFASLCIAFVGFVLSGVAENSMATATETRMPIDTVGQWATNLLTFYWFRLADFAIPMGLSIVCVRVVGSLTLRSRFAVQRYSVGLFTALVLIAGGLMMHQRWNDPRPGADRVSLPTYPGEKQRTIETCKNWKKACVWAGKNTAPDSLFITPDAQQTFKWYAGRAEVVCWKDVPQDAYGVIEWNQRIEVLNKPQRTYALGLLAYDETQLLELARTYAATHMIVPQIQVDTISRAGGRFPVNPRIRKIYPVDDTKSTYVIFEFEGVNNSSRN